MSSEEINFEDFTDEEQDLIKKNRKRCIIGSPETVVAKLKELETYYQTDEFMIITNIYNFKDKKKSYKLLAEAITE